MKKNKKVDLNSLGRFSMSDWFEFEADKVKKNSSNWVKVKNFGLTNLEKFLKKKFNQKQISKMTMLDIGCNDGYLTEKLAKLKFKKSIGIEPRRDAILRGKKIRKKLKIKSNAKYFTKSIKDLKNMNSFDISICSGVLHHTDNFFENLKIILGKTKNLMLLEGEFLPDRIFNNDNLIKRAQLKDIIYEDFFLKKLNLKNFFGITLQKLETNTYDGSTIKTGFVDIPSVYSVIQYCKIIGYDAKLISSKSFQNPFNVYRAILTISKSNLNLKKIDFNFEFEKFFLTTIVPIKELNKLKNLSSLKKINKKVYKKYEIIFKRLKFNFMDKINLEYAKYFYNDNDKKSAKKYLFKIINKQNSDWFTCYRAYFLMYKIDFKNNSFWKKKLKICNPNFPKKFFNKNIAISS